MWEIAVAGAVGLLWVYVVLRREIWRGYERLHKDIVHKVKDLDALDGPVR